MASSFRCRECNSLQVTRVGRGLCRGCWDDPKIRRKHKMIAPFGGSQAGKLGAEASNDPIRLSICERCERPISGDYLIIDGDTVCRGCLEVVGAVA